MTFKSTHFDNFLECLILHAKEKEKQTKTAGFFATDRNFFDHVLKQNTKKLFQISLSNFFSLRGVIKKSEQKWLENVIKIVKKLKKSSQNLFNFFAGSF